MAIDPSIPQGLVARFKRRMAAGGPFKEFRLLVCRLAGALAAELAKSDFASKEKYNIVIGWVKDFIELTLPRVTWPAYLAWIALIPVTTQQQIVFFILKGAIDAAIEGVLGLLKEKGA